MFPLCSLIGLRPKRICNARFRRRADPDALTTEPPRLGSAGRIGDETGHRVHHSHTRVWLDKYPIRLPLDWMMLGHPWPRVYAIRNGCVPWSGLSPASPATTRVVQPGFAIRAKSGRMDPGSDTAFQSMVERVEFSERPWRIRVEAVCFSDTMPGGERGPFDPLARRLGKR